MVAGYMGRAITINDNDLKNRSCLKLTQDVAHCMHNYEQLLHIIKGIRSDAV